MMSRDTSPNMTEALLSIYTVMRLVLFWYKVDNNLGYYPPWVDIIEWVWELTNFTAEQLEKTLVGFLKILCN